MRHWTLLFILLAGLPISALSQASTPFEVTIEEVNLTNAPGLQSFVVGQDDKGRWLLIGGRTDGLHLRRPFESFLASDNNRNIFVVDPYLDTTYSAPLSGLPTGLQEQLQSTNMEFYQRDNRLYIIGGYAYATSAGDHITFPNLTAVNVSATIDAIIKGQPIAPYFQQITDPRMQVTGGYLGYLDSIFYLVGGQKFMGRYNPMGPGHGPGFIQEYTNAIRTFKIQDNGQQISITDFHEVTDSANLHRRDYNMAPQIFPDGSAGFTVFSGVFQYTSDLPWLNTVDITPTQYKVRPQFNQYLSQYHSAHLPVYDTQGQTMHTIFFGGMSRYTLHPITGQLVDDQNVPFVKTVSMVSRYPNDSMVEAVLPFTMPGYLGASAEFIPRHDIGYQYGEILDLSALPDGKNHVGYIYGGIESTAPNIFFINDGTQSHATNRCFKVYITKGRQTNIPVPLSGDHLLGMEVAPNPATHQAVVKFWVPTPMKVTLTLQNLQGQTLQHFAFGQLSTGTYRHEIALSHLPEGSYMLRLSGNQWSKSVHFIHVKP